MRVEGGGAGDGRGGKDGRDPGDEGGVCGRAPSRVEFPGVNNGPTSRVWFLSADNPDNIRGYGFKGLVIDEAASIPVDVWHYVLRPTIAQTLGWAVFGAPGTHLYFIHFVRHPS